MAGSCWRKEPAAALRGLTNVCKPASSRSSLIRLNSLCGIYASPRISMKGGAFSITNGID